MEFLEQNFSLLLYGGLDLSLVMRIKQNVNTLSLNDFMSVTDNDNYTDQDTEKADSDEESGSSGDLFGDDKADCNNDQDLHVQDNQDGTSSEGDGHNENDDHNADNQEESEESDYTNEEQQHLGQIHQEKKTNHQQQRSVVNKYQNLTIGLKLDFENELIEFGK